MGSLLLLAAASLLVGRGDEAPSPDPGVFALAASLRAPTERRAVKCEELWTIRSMGLEVGRSRESFQADAGGSFMARSEFDPSPAARAFGLGRLERESHGADASLLRRSETLLKGAEIIRSAWERLPGGGYSRKAGSQESQAGSYSGPTLDTTALPRTAMMGWIEPGREIEARILLAGASPAIVRISMAADGSSISARSGEFAFEVGLDANRRPVRMDAKAGKIDTVSRLASGGCSP